MTQTINFTRGVPAIESFPVDELVDAAGAILRTSGATALQYGPALGFQPLREWLAQWQGVAADRVLTANGSLQIIEFLCVHMIKPGDVVFTEAPTYDRTLGLLRRHHAKVVGIPLQDDGPDVEALERALAVAVPKLFYIIPDFQNPAGATCSGAKRRRIAELAERHGFLLLEDAPYRLLRYRGREEPTLYELAPERTLHMSSFTKLIAPGVRTGVALVGFGFLTKQLQVMLIVPPFALAHLWAARGPIGRRVTDLLVAGAAVVASAGWWVALVELWPARRATSSTFAPAAIHPWASAASAPIAPRSTAPTTGRRPTRKSCCSPWSRPARP